MSPEDKNSPQAEAIEDAAANWLVQMEEGLDPRQSEEFERWRQADRRHEVAFARLEAACRILEKMPALPEARFQARRSYRPWMWAAAAGLALAVVGWWVLPSRGRNYSREYTTTTGGYQRVTLPDGSVIELNASSEVRVQFSAAERRVGLGAGEALFSVAKNPARPFIVSAGRISVRAVGTAFEVRLAKSGVEVFVSEGRVQVSEKSESMEAPAGPPLLLAAGHRVLVPTMGVPTSSQVEKIDEPAIRNTLSWQAPRLVFVDTPLADVVAQFNHWNRVQLVLGDAALAGRPVGGNFRADNVEAFVRLLESSRDIAIARPSSDRIILYRTPEPGR